MDEFEDWPLTEALIDAYLEVAHELGSWRTTIEYNTVDELWEHMGMENKDRKKIEKPSKEEFMLLITPLYNAKVIDKVRTRRDDLLAASDWTQLADIKNVDALAWADYRQLLRDVPASLEIEFGKELKSYFPTQP